MTALPWFDLPPGQNPAPTSVVVVGAGLAGCTTARKLAEHGLQVTVLEQGLDAASGASGNRCALLRPHAGRDTSQANQFFSDAYVKALLWLSSLPCKQPVYRTTGALQLSSNTQGYRESEHLQAVSREAARQLCGVDVATGGLFFPTACCVDIAATCQALLTHPDIKLLPSFEVTSLSREENRWFISNNKQTVNASTVVLANGAALGRFPGTKELTITVARGQTTTLDAGNRESPAVPLCGRHYLIPLSVTAEAKPGRQLWQVGASFDRNNDQAVATEADDKKNIQGATELLGERLIQPGSIKHLSVVDHWAAVRATTPDRLPVTGALPDRGYYIKEYADLHHGRPTQDYPAARYLPGLYVNGGFGSRGLSVAALCAELLLAQITGCAGHTDSNNSGSRACKNNRYLQLLHPARFHIRRLKKSTAR